MLPMKHTGTEIFSLRRCFTETPYHRSTNMYYKSSLEDAKKKKSTHLSCPQQVYSRTETDVDSSKIAKSTSVMFMN